MARTSIALSVTTRKDTFSDYLRLDAYKAAQLNSRADVALGNAAPARTWFLPMPQLIERRTDHHYEVVEQSIAYSLSKGIAQGRQAQVDAAQVSLLGAGIGSGASRNMAAGGYDIGEAIGGLLYLSGVGSQIGGAIGMIPTIQDFQNNLSSEFTDQPSIGMATQELKYGGTNERSFNLNYEFIAKEPGDVYGPNGILQILAELESWSFPISFADEVSRRDLIKTPPIFTLKHVRLDAGGGFSMLSDSEPLAALGQPQLLILRKVYGSHQTKSVIIDGAFSYPIISSVQLELADMEPLARLDGVYASYGKISVPKIACRSEIYARAIGERGSITTT
tara:strand:- start:761 stop:1765 length:1005 start_codon:yes stop_codon:yes gene_type:complete